MKEQETQEGNFRRHQTKKVSFCCSQAFSSVIWETTEPKFSVIHPYTFTLTNSIRTGHILAGDGMAQGRSVL
jgi:hypothetical protein